MKALIFLLFLTPLAAFSQNGPVDYNDKIVEYQNEIGYKLVAFIEYLGQDGATKVETEALRQDIVKATKSSIAGLEKMSAYEGNDDLRKAALNLFNFYLRVAENDYKKIIDIVYKEDFSDADATALTEVATKVEDEEIGFDAAFEKAQLAFAAKYGFDLEENELQELIDEE